MAKNVILYSTATCPYCIMAKRFLEENNIEHTHIDVSEDQAAAQEMINKSGQMGVPVIDIDGEVIIGFDRPKMETALKNKKLV